MKYVIAQSPMGQRLSLIFPDHETHAVMFEVLKILHGNKTSVVSAGFIALPKFECYGKSESLGDLESRGELDTAILLIGEQAAFMPDSMMLPLYHKWLAIQKDKP